MTITKELVAQWWDEYVVTINPSVGPYTYIAQRAAAHGAAERERELMSMGGLEPVDDVRIHDGHEYLYVRACDNYYTATQLAAARLQGAEEERNRFVEANKDPLTELYFARKEIEELKQAGVVNQGLLDIAYEVANAMPVNASQHIVRIGTVEAARAAIAAAEQEKTK